MAKIFTFILLTSFVSQSASQIDLGPLCQAMWHGTKDNLRVPSELMFNDNPTEDHPLFELTMAGKAKIDDPSNAFNTFQALLTDPESTVRQDEFFNAIMGAGGPVRQAYDYLEKPNPLYTLPRTTTMARFECMLRDIWFARPGKGFEHVFVGERTEPSFSGFHNWYQFYLEQSKIKITKDSFEFTYLTEPSFIKGLEFEWNSLKKYEPTSMFVGTSPAFDFALFSVCFLALHKGTGVDKECTCRIQNNQIKLRVLIFKNMGRVSSVFPVSVKAHTCTAVPPADRTDCGWYGIDRRACAKRGCCLDNKKYGFWTHFCFYPSDHICHVHPTSRNVCGDKQGISRKDCEGQGCCFEENVKKGAYRCFVPRKNN